MKLSIIIPAYNEGNRIKPTLAEYLAFFSNELELIVMVEGTDSTLEIVKEFAINDKRVRYFYSKEKLGKGGAITEGFRHTAGDFIGFVDADCSTKPEAFAELVKNLDKFDGVIASRKMFGAKLLKKEPFMQRIGSRGFNALVKVLFVLPFKDTQCGAKVFRRNVIEKTLPLLGITEFSFDVDLLYQIKRSGFKIKELPTTWEHKTGGKFDFDRKFIDRTLQMFLSVIRLRLLYSPFKKLIKIYDYFFGK